MESESTSATGGRQRFAPIVAGAVTAIAGIVILVWPGKAAMAVTGIVAVYAIVTGLVYLAIGIVARPLGTGSRIGHVLLGVLYIAAGCLALAELRRSAAFLAIFVAILVGVMWIIEGFVSLTTPEEGVPRAATVVFAVISIIAGVLLLSSPLWAVVMMWWLVAVSLLVIGVVNVVRGLVGRRT